MKEWAKATGRETRPALPFVIVAFVCGRIALRPYGRTVLPLILCFNILCGIPRREGNPFRQGEKDSKGRFLSHPIYTQSNRIFIRPQGW